MIEAANFINLLYQAGLKDKSISGEIQDYLTGKTDSFEIKDSLLGSAGGYYLEVLRAAFKDADESLLPLAGRMCRVVVALHGGNIKVSYGGHSESVALIYALSRVYDFRATFETVLDNVREIQKACSSGMRLKIEIEVNFRYACGNLLKFRRDEAEAFMASMAAKPADSVAEELGDNISGLTSLMFAAYFDDDEKYKTYGDKVLEYCEKINPVKALTVLAWGLNMRKDYVEAFNKLAADNMDIMPFIMDVITNRHLMPLNKSGADLKAYMERRGVSIALYYINEILNDCFFRNGGIKGMKALSVLYAENREVFSRIYCLCKSSYYSGAVAAYPAMTAILLNNSDPEADIDLFHNDPSRLVFVLNYSSETLKKMGGWNQDSAVMKKKITDCFTPDKDNTALLRRMSFGSYEAEFLRDIMPLYQYSGQVRDIIDPLIGIKSPAVIAGYVAVAEACFGVSREEAASFLIKEKGVTVGDFTEAMFAGFGHEAGITEDFIKNLVKSDEKSAAAALGDAGLLEAIREQSVDNVAAAVILYYGAGLEDTGPACRLLVSDSSKKVQAACVKVLEEREEQARPILEEYLKTARSVGKNAINAVIKKWDDARKPCGDFKFENVNGLMEFVDDNYDKSLERHARWIDDGMFSGVKTISLSEEVPPKAVRYVIMEYMALKEPCRVKAADKAAEVFDRKTFTDVLENIYQSWVADGAETKHKNVMIPYCLYGTEPQLLKLRRQIEEWAKNYRGALGSYIVSAMAMNGRPFALMIVDGIASKFPNAQVKTAAKKAFSVAAKALGVPEDVLGDKIVPDLGFSPDGVKILDFGSRTFTLRLMPSFEIEITDDEKGKIVKSLPKPGTGDDPARAEAARQEFSGLKKSLKAVIQMQTARLEKVLMNGRTWDAGSWKELFVDNPIMNVFAIKLIWGVYGSGGNLIKSFRYMEDGTFNTADEEEYILPEKSIISLVHPSDLTEAELENWKGQLDDYEITQPFSQIEAKVYEPGAEDIKDNAVIMFENKKITVSMLSSVAKKLNMQRGAIWDAGCFWEYFLEDAVIGIGVEINFSDMFVGADFAETVTFGTVVFYSLEKTGTLKEACTDVNKFAKNEGLDPRTLPKRFVSSVLSVIDGCINKQAV